MWERPCKVEHSRNSRRMSMASVVPDSTEEKGLMNMALGQHRILLLMFGPICFLVDSFICYQDDFFF